MGSAAALKQANKRLRAAEEAYHKALSARNSALGVFVSEALTAGYTIERAASAAGMAYGNVLRIWNRESTRDGGLLVGPRMKDFDQRMRDACAWLDGRSYNEIALLRGVSSVAVGEGIKNTLRDVDERLYELCGNLAARRANKAGFVSKMKAFRATLEKDIVGL